MNTKKGLGRGLAALIPGSDMEFLGQVARGETPARLAAAPATTEIATSVLGAPKTGTVTAGGIENGDIQWLLIDSIVANPFQPRRHFSPEELAELVASITEHGLLQPILVRPAPSSSDGEAGYQLIAGERRWRAATVCGLTHIPAVVRAVDDRQALELAIVENVQRHDISAIDTALAYRRLVSEFGLSQEEVGKRVGKSRPAVANTLRLLELPQEARAAIENGDLSEGHGRAILLAGGEGARRALLKRVLRDKLSVRETERLAQASNDAGGIKGGRGGRASDALTAERRDLQLKLQKRLGARVEIAGQGKSGRVSIRYASLEEFDRICELLLG